ncbi:mechanosensitive ion channel family protein, partial [Candidatus Woesearchaeota archaeon]|nr:mechanosensitive ion channel family protein [Candidatus Woesearchaeota archaeon]
MSLTISQILKLIPPEYYLNNLFILALIIFVAFIILAKGLQLLFNLYLKKVASKTESQIDDLIFERTKTPLFYLILAYGLKVSLFSLNINGVVQKLVSSMMAIVFVLAITRSIDVLLEAWGITFAKKTKTHLDDILLPLFRKATRVILIVVAVLWVLKIWKVDITPYLAGVGISGIVLGLALQDSLKNIFGGITLIIDKTYKVGDKIKLESGDIGTIYDVGLRSTKLITFDNEVVYIPNGYLANSRVQNYTHPDPKVRSKVEFGVAYGTDVEKVKKIVLEAIKNTDGILTE